MSKARPAQLNIRSEVARRRVDEITRQTGMTATQVVEEALLRFVPPPQEPLPPGLIRKGPILVLKGSGRKITAEQVQRSIDEDRDERGRQLLERS